MTANFPSLSRSGSGSADTPALPQPVAQPVPLTSQFAVQLSSTPRGARLARLLAVQQLADWGWPYDGDASQALALVVAELASNAVRHGRVPGRDFRLRLSCVAGLTLRVEVVDALGEVLLPLDLAESSVAGDAEWGRGLALVAAVADRWGELARPQPCKTVWAELDFSGVGDAGDTRSRGGVVTARPGKRGGLSVSGDTPSVGFAVL